MGELVSPDSYKYIYLGLVTVLVIAFSLGYKVRTEYESRSSGYRKALIVGAFFILYFGTRPQYGTAMADTAGYAGTYEMLRHGIGLYNLDWNVEAEIVWKWLANTMAAMDFSVASWFTVVAAIYILFNIWGIKRISPGFIYPFFLFYIVFFLFFSGGTNGIRNADAYSIVFFAITLYTRPCLRNYILMGILCLIAYQIHTSMIVTICAFLLSLFVVKKPNHAIIIWLVAIVMALGAGNYLANNFASLIDDGRADKYLEYASNSKMMQGFSHVGFRWDFLLFSSLPIILGWYAVVKRGFQDKIYVLLLNTYIIANAVWIVFIYAAFSNRFAMLSWCIYPYVLCYPLFKAEIWPQKTQATYTVILLWIQLLFTYYMIL